MHQLSSEHRTRCVVVPIFILSCILISGIFLVLSSEGQSQGPHRIRLVRRYPTERQIIGPTYHLHKLPDMPIDLKAGYERRRERVRNGRLRVQARSAILDRFRRSVQSSLDDKRRYLPLLSSSNDEQLNLTCNTCSVVANTGIMRRSSLGKQIDEADCIFRVDTAPTVGYERDVGRRTTVRVVSYTSISNFASEAETLVALQPSASHVVFHGPAHVFEGSASLKYLQHISKSRHDMEMFRTSPAFEDEADFEFLKHTAKSRSNSGLEFSTDMYALIIAQDACSSITVYGMLPRNYCQENPGNSIAFNYHKDQHLTACIMYDYHDDLATGGQPLLAEKHVFDGWRMERDIRFVNPAWD